MGRVSAARAVFEQEIVRLPESEQQQSQVGILCSAAFSPCNIHSCNIACGSWYPSLKQAAVPRLPRMVLRLCGAGNCAGFCFLSVPVMIPRLHVHQVVLTATAVVVVLDSQYRPKRISGELRELFASDA